MQVQSLFAKLSADRLSIGQRLNTITATMLITLALIASLAFFSLSFARQSSSELQQQVWEVTQLTKLIKAVQEGLVGKLNALNSGMVTWDGAEPQLAASKKDFTSLWRTLQQRTLSLGAETHTEFTTMQKSVLGVEAAFAEVGGLSANRSRGDLELFLLNDLQDLVGPFIDSASRYTANLSMTSQQTFSNSEAILRQALIFGTLIITVSLAVAAGLGYVIRRSILKPVAVIATTVQQVEQGDTNARTNLAGRDELAELGRTLDHLLSEKVATLVAAEKENEVLNDSVIELLEGTSQLSERNLNTRLMVREDITGPVADALNLVTKEISEALGKISHVSRLVEVTSVMVDEQNRSVVALSEQDRETVAATSAQLESLAQHMGQIAKWCQTCNQIAKSTAGTTDKAHEAVGNTVESMGEIRDSISETEKKIKRLSERSQEISSIIDLINSIAERTHVLALNASMQAAAAGEAGRGFAVVADEVQRLAESSRNATSQISTLVRNIQTETADAVDKMNESIAQVVSGTKRASQAGQEMQQTQKSARDLLNAVERIAHSSIVQAKEAQKVQTEALKIEQSAEQTGKELQRQALYTERLRTASGVLLDTVQLFELPASVMDNVQLPELLAELEEPERIAKTPYIPTASTANSDLKKAS